MPLQDTIKTTKKENFIGNMRQAGNMQYSGPEKITVYERNKKSDGKELLEIISKIKNLKNNYSQKKSQEHFDQPFEDLIPIQIRNNEWYATAHQALGACLEGVDFKNFTTADAQLN